MKRPDKAKFLKYGINAAQTMEAFDKYIDYIESQNKQMYKALKEEKEMLKIDLKFTSSGLLIDGYKERIDKIESLLKEIENES